jgi:hypothetical protein
MQKRQDPLTWHQRDKDRLLRNVNKNLPLNIIAKIYGVSGPTIKRWTEILTNTLPEDKSVNQHDVSSSKPDSLTDAEPS